MEASDQLSSLSAFNKQDQIISPAVQLLVSPVESSTHDGEVEKYEGGLTKISYKGGLTRKTFSMFIFTDNDFSLDALTAGNRLSVTLRRFSLPSLLVLPTPIQTGCLWERHLFL